MQALYRILALVAIALVGATQGSFARSALSTLTVDPPPLPRNAATADIFDAMLAIGRAKATYPAGARRAAAAYAAALERYRAGDLAAAQRDALQAIALTTHAPYADPDAWASPSPTVSAVVPMPALVETGQADAESHLALARRALGQCGVSDAALLQALQQRYSAGVAENLMHRYAEVIADARTIIDACIIRTPAFPGLPAPAPTPS